MFRLTTWYIQTFYTSDQVHCSPSQMHFVVGDCWKWTRRFQEQILWADLFTQSCLWPQVRLVWTHLYTLMQSMNFTSIWISLFYPSGQNLPSNSCNPSLLSFHLQSFGFNSVHKRSVFFNCVITVAKSYFTVCPFEFLEFGLFESTEGHKECIPHEKPKDTELV